MKSEQKELKTNEAWAGTQGEWKVRFLREDDPYRGFFIEAPNKKRPDLGYGIEIMMDDFGDHNGYTLEQRMADAKLIADAGNTIQKCGMMPSELLSEVENLKQQLSLVAKGIHRAFSAEG